MLNYLWVGLGGALGSIARFWASRWIAQNLSDALPWGTLIVNVSGSFAIGLFATYAGPDARWLVSPSARLFFMTGICGGYTTFSAFSLQTFELAREGKWSYAAAYTVLSFALCIIAVWIGHVAATALQPAKGSH